MKTQLIRSLFICGLMLQVIQSGAQSASKKELISVLNIDTRGIGMEPSAVGQMVRTELEKLDTFEVKDRYDVQQVLEENKVNMSNCYGKTCLTEMGLLLKSDKMFSGSVEQVGKTIVFTYRQLDVKTSRIEKTYVHEFLYIPEEIQNMVKLSVLQMYERSFDNNLMNKLSKRFEFDNSNNNPTIERLKLDGPRMGFVTYTGDLQRRMMESKKQGGFDVIPVMFMFGYQFEKQYLNEGKAQALFEFIPLITGLDQGYFIPSITLLHGLRSNVNGWEFAFGPTFNLVPIAKGYYDAANDWQLENNWRNNPSNQGKENPYEIVERTDSRGIYKIKSSFILAAGRTFKSGKLNIPVNAFVVPHRDGFRIGISMGFNARNR